MEAGLTEDEARAALDSMGSEPIPAGPSGRRYRHPWSDVNDAIPKWIIIDGVKHENPEWTNAVYEEVLLMKEDMPI